MYGYCKNMSGQNIGFGLVNASNGSALTGASVTVNRCVDGGSQASATGTVTEKGNGQYDYALSQADTNGDQVSFLFTATNAVPVEKTIVTCPALSVANTVSVRGGLPAVGYKSGTYYDCALSGVFTSNGVYGADRASIIPFFCRTATTFDRIAVENTSTGNNGDKIRLSVIADNGGTPDGGTVLANPAELTLDGTAKDNPATISLSLDAGQLVWLCVIANDQVTLRSIQGSTQDLIWSGFGGNTAVGSFSNIRADFTYGATPSPFAATDYYLNDFQTSARIRLRAA